MKYNPLSYLRKDRSVFGKVSRLRWDSVREVPPHFPAQEDNGSWNNSVVDTVKYLYQLSLFSNNLEERVRKALNWLLEKGHPPMKYQSNDGASYDDMFFRTSRSDNEKLRKLKGTPFSMGCSGFFKTGACLYLAAQFGYLEDKRVEKAYLNIIEIPPYRDGWYCSPSCGSNLFLAVVEHPIYSSSRAIHLNLDYLNRTQMENGAWQGPIPFFSVFNALAKLKMIEADRIFRFALNRLEETQNKDGSWGRTDKALKTYLVMDALVRKDIRISM
jgi:hypothetical protein